MDIIFTLIFIVGGLAVTLYLLSKVRTIVSVLAWICALYLFFVADNFWGGIIVIVLWGLFQNIVSSFDESSSKQPKKRTSTVSRKHKNEPSFNWNLLIMILIPLFWPILIFRFFFADKQTGKLDAYDYEQHQRTNGK